MSITATLIACVFGLTTAVAAADDFRIEPGFRSLFNGKDLSGWLLGREPLNGKVATADRRFVAADGVLTITGAGPGQPKMTEIDTVEEFNADFVLRFEFRASPEANSGLHLRDKEFRHQFQVRDYPRVGPYKDLARYKAGDWNAVEVTVRAAGDGATARCTCNGEVLEAALPIPARGSLALQSETNVVEYRRIRVGPPAGATAAVAPPPVFATAELLQDRGAGEGPAWHPALGLLTSGEGHIYRRSRQGEVSVYRRDAGSNGLAFDRQGRLLICEPVRRRVSRLEADGRLAVLAERFEGKRFNQPNDVATDSKGRIYFSDPVYGDPAGMEMTDASRRSVEGVYRIDPDGAVTRVIGREVERANGLAVSADDRTLFVADNNNNHVGGARKVWRFPLRADGTVDATGAKVVYDWGATRGPDGLKLDTEGRLFVAAGINRPNAPYETQERATAGVYVFDPEGKLLGLIPVPRDECTNCAFGGDDLRTLFVTAGGTLWGARMPAPGLVAFPPARDRSGSN